MKIKMAAINLGRLVASRESAGLLVPTEEGEEEKSLAVKILA